MIFKLRVCSAGYKMQNFIGNVFGMQISRDAEKKRHPNAL